MNSTQIDETEIFFQISIDKSLLKACSRLPIAINKYDSYTIDCGVFDSTKLKDLSKPSKKLFAVCD